MKQLLIAVVVALFAFFATPISGQNAPSQPAGKIPVHVKLMTRNHGDSVVLRWAFSEPEAWRWLNAQGWILERFELDATTNKAGKPNRSSRHR